ncbi:MAG: LegC family aminotransferase [Acidobacteriota bacterium]|nr:MAG: DegT/DnrJ/EryC1/StrS family aminotransferase [Acidobacteriota bacterium]
MTSPPRPSLPSCADASGRSFGERERELVLRVLESGTLNGTRGTMVPELERRLAETFGVPWARTCSSGTAAIHAAIAAVDPEPGDEIVTTPITDMGAITPIVYQSAIPVFADVDPDTFNVTAETVERCLTRRTRAVIVTHLFGGCAEIDPIAELCRSRGLVLIEDAAQAYLATDAGRLAGTIGDIGCFSLQQSKQITCGEGGFVLCRDERLARRIRIFVDKAWPYGEDHPDHEFLALNYRMTELQAAVALAQLERLPELVACRRRTAARLTELIDDVPGVGPPAVRPGTEHAFWRYPLRVDPARIRGGADALGARLKEAGIFCAPRYVRRLAFECRVLAEQRSFGDSRFPWVGEHRRDDPPVVYSRDRTPGAVAALERVVVLPWNERIDERHVAYIARTIRDAARELAA